MVWRLMGHGLAECDQGFDEQVLPQGLYTMYSFLKLQVQFQVFPNHTLTLLSLLSSAFPMDICVFQKSHDSKYNCPWFSMG